MLPVVIDTLARGHRRAVQWGPLIEADIADKRTLEKVFSDYSIEAVMHFAAFAYVGESMRSRSLYFQNNVAGTINLLEVMRQNSVRKMVFSSTCATYGDPKQIPIPEEHPQSPVNPYGASKVMVEDLLRWNGAVHGLNSVVL